MFYWIDALVVLFCGSALILSVFNGQLDLAGNISTGLLGYIGGNAAFSAKMAAAEKANTDSTTKGTEKE